MRKQDLISLPLLQGKLERSVMKQLAETNPTVPPMQDRRCDGV